jgi:hypothetical protein
MKYAASEFRDALARLLDEPEERHLGVAIPAPQAELTVSSIPHTGANAQEFTS